jgi:glycosyltransferase involved in cell wall biosynthesis
MATVDVLMPVKNAGPYLSEAIESVMGQTFADWRLLVLDHGSNDGSLEVAREYQERDSRIVVLEFPAADGLSGLLNLGLAQADGRYVLRQDADDVSMPSRFAALCDAFESDRELVLVGTAATIIDASGETVGRLSQPASPAAISAAAFFYNPIIHPSCGMRLDYLSKHQVRYGTDIIGALPGSQSIEVKSLAEDYFLFGQLAITAKCLNLNAPLLKYRRHAGSVSVEKYREQLTCSVEISRFLARSFAAMRGTERFDPGPFCSHGEAVFDGGAIDYSHAYSVMAASLVSGLGESPDLTRELAFRRVLSKRTAAPMALSYAGFVAKHGLRSDELRVVRNWLGRDVVRKRVFRLDEPTISNEVRTLPPA